MFKLTFEKFKKLKLFSIFGKQKQKLFNLSCRHSKK